MLAADKDPKEKIHYTHRLHRQGCHLWPDTFLGMNTDNYIVKLLRLHQFFKCDEHFCIPTGKMANNSHIIFFISITTGAFSLLSIECSVVYFYC